MDATSESEGQKEISKWMEQVQAARNSLYKARKASLLLDDPAILDRAWERYFRKVKTKGPPRTCRRF